MADDMLMVDGDLIDDLRVVDLKRHLDTRGLSKSGSKTQLLERLKARIQLEREQTLSSDSQNEDIEHTSEDEDEINSPGTKGKAQSEFVKQYFEQQKKLNEIRETEKKKLSKGGRGDADAANGDRPSTLSPGEMIPGGDDTGSGSRRRSGKHSAKQETPKRSSRRVVASKQSPTKSSATEYKSANQDTDDLPEPQGDVSRVEAQESPQSKGTQRLKGDQTERIEKGGRSAKKGEAKKCESEANNESFTNDEDDDKREVKEKRKIECGTVERGTVERDTVKTVERDTVKTVERDIMKTVEHDTVKTVKRDTVKTVERDTVKTVEESAVDASSVDAGKDAKYDSDGESSDTADEGGGADRRKVVEVTSVKERLDDSRQDKKSKNGDPSSQTKTSGDVSVEVEEILTEDGEERNIDSVSGGASDKMAAVRVEDAVSASSSDTDTEDVRDVAASRERRSSRQDESEDARGKESENGEKEDVDVSKRNVLPDKDQEVTSDKPMEEDPGETTSNGSEETKSGDTIKMEIEESKTIESSVGRNEESPLVSQSSKEIIEKLGVDDEAEELDYDETMESESSAHEDSDLERDETTPAGEQRVHSTEEGEIDDAVEHKSRSKRSSKAHRSSKDRSRKSGSQHKKSRQSSSKHETSPAKKSRRSPIRAPETATGVAKTRVKARRSDEKDSVKEDEKRDSRRRREDDRSETREVVAVKATGRGSVDDKDQVPDVTSRREEASAMETEVQDTPTITTHSTEPGKTVRQISRRTSRHSNKEERDKSGRKRKWGSSSKSESSRGGSKSYNISTDSLKALIPDIAPVSFKHELDEPDTPESEREGGAVEDKRNLEDTRDVKIQRVITQDVTKGQEGEDKEGDNDEMDVETEVKREEIKEESDESEKGIKKKSAKKENEGEEEESRRIEMKEDPVMVKISISKSTPKPATKPHMPVITLEADIPQAARRSPSPARHPEDCVIHVTNLTRPFTLNQLKELFKRTGSLVDGGFWIDRIKSHCYVTFESVEEAVKTRRSLHGTKWPLSNPKILRIEFSSPSEFERHRSQESGLESDIIPKKKPVVKPEKRPSPARGRHTSREEKRRGEEKDKDKDKEKREDERNKSREDRNRDDRRGKENDRLREDRRIERLKTDEARRRAEVPMREWDIGKVRDGSGEMQKSQEVPRERVREGDTERSQVRGERPLEGEDGRLRDRGERLREKGERLREGDGGRSRDRDGEKDRHLEERERHPHKEAVKETEEPPAKLLDDLFKKTKATPSIYWLPLTDNQVAERLERLKKMKVMYKTEAEYLQEEMRPFQMGLPPPPMGMPPPPMMLGPPPMGMMIPPPPDGARFFQHDRRDRSRRSGSRENRRGRRSRSRDKRR